IPAEFSTTINHTQGPPYDVPVHAVQIVPESPLHKLLGKERIEVNSYHHQGIKALAKGLEAMAYAPDGLVEAVHMPAHPYLWAVQWHPEFALEDENSRKIFASFVGSECLKTTL
ncbi:MAG: gamma-glutamyl-gamma-aminobutyrate hydrolase family protein, partial [Zoogloeaceae bacterium]|nr:gamma-glutamyl-gamma-aminobutyrate hydrolase family protein [Zoogloeaceae bacterium]